jgi:hypothetical protein
MEMLYDIVKAEARSDFRVWVRFEDGLEGEVDLSDLVGRGVFKRWQDDPSEFEQVEVDPESGTVVWPGGLDVAPDRLYSDVAKSAGKVSTSGLV